LDLLNVRCLRTTANGCNVRRRLPRDQDEPRDPPVTGFGERGGSRRAGGKLPPAVKVILKQILMFGFYILLFTYEIDSVCTKTFVTSSILNKQKSFPNEVYNPSESKTLKN